MKKIDYTFLTQGNIPTNVYGAAKHLYKMQDKLREIKGNGKSTTGQNIKLSLQDILEIHNKEFPEDKVIEKEKEKTEKETTEKLQQLVKSFNVAIETPEVEHLLLIPCFILDFLCVYPYKERGDKVSRLLTDQLLINLGFDVVTYVSFEEQLLKSVEDYHKSFLLSIQNWKTNKQDYFPFVENFILTLYNCYKEMERVLQEEAKGTEVRKKQRIEDVLLNNQVPREELYKLLLDVSPSTIEIILNVLIQENKIPNNELYLKHNEI